MTFIKRFFFFLTLFVAFPLFSQVDADSLLLKNPELKGVFLPSNKQRFGAFVKKVQYKKHKEFHFYKSIGYLEADIINFQLNIKKFKNFNQVTFVSQGVELRGEKLNPSTVQIQLKPAKANYVVEVKVNEDVIAVLHVVILKKKIIPIDIVPLSKILVNEDSIEMELNNRFKAANITFDVQIKPVFKDKQVNEVSFWVNPNSSRLKYTRQMQQLRNAYFSRNPNFKKNKLLFFVIPSFKNEEVHSYMVKNKALGFLTNSHIDSIGKYISHEYLLGFVNTTEDFSMEDFFILSENMWLEVNENPNLYSYIDDYEDVVTNNGLIAYYLFKENSTGEIELVNDDFLSSVARPFKRNTYSYHLQIDSVFYKTIFIIGKKHFNSLHVIGSIIVFITGVIGFRKLRKWMKQKWKRTFLIRFLLLLIEWIVIPISIWMIVLLVDLGYSWFEVKDGIIQYYHNKNQQQVLDLLFLNEHPRKIEERNVGSEIIVHKGNDYYLSQRKKVLYFKMNVDEKGKPLHLQFVAHSDQLKTSLVEKPIKAESHYLVLKIHSKSGKWLKDKVYNHLGVELTDKLTLDDPPKRILLFVNGYRPTSLGGSFEENFSDIMKNGLEFPNSVNRLFTEDRYNYWHPWMKIDDLFKSRINPSETYYADGHHSVATSNHRSIINFTTASQTYPKRCTDKNHHTCYQTEALGLSIFGSEKISTYKKLATKSNRKGFKIRVNSGRIAGRNLIQMLNELPNKSENDTLYIVAHSMGFAYTQGIVKELRGRIQLGGYYIIAPENAKAGKVVSSKWQEIWQYGSNLGEKYQDAPCLQDGVAPQSKPEGLPQSHRLFIPETRYKTKGFFDSHFIGWYTWILDIPKGEKGYVSSH